MIYIRRKGSARNEIVGTLEGELHITAILPVCSFIGLVVCSCV